MDIIRELPSPRIKAMVHPIPDPESTRPFEDMIGKDVSSEAVPATLKERMENWGSD